MLVLSTLASSQCCTLACSLMLLLLCCVPPLVREEFAFVSASQYNSEPASCPRSAFSQQLRMQAAAQQANPTENTKTHDHNMKKMRIRIWRL